MKFTLSWLKKHLDTTATLEEIAEKLTSLGLEVDGIDNPAEKFADFKVAYVEKAERHPDADRLQICTVQTENKTFNVVCGAPNARAGIKGIFAPEGSYIPGSDMVLKKGVIRGVESCGMLVSEREMDLSDEHEGIIEVDDRFEVGTPMASVFGLDDPVIDIDLTPNRVDCAGIRGIARDLAAAGLGTLKPLEIPAIQTNGASEISVSIEDTDGCALFLGRTIKGVKNGSSPDWLQQLLKAVGLRPISALVDITNLMTLEHCRPLHVYDISKLNGNISVKETQDGVELEALDDKTYKMSQGSVGIFDEKGQIGLGGIVGGTSTGVDENTTDVFLEAAYFNPQRIAKTGRNLGVESDARYRFERGIDPNFTFDGIEIATQLIVDICDGSASEIVKAGDLPECTKGIDYNPDIVKTLIGMDVSISRQKEILSALGFDIAENGDTLSVTAPSWRPDIWAVDTNGKADLAEEIMRIEGIDDLPEISVRSEHAIPNAAETENLKRSRLARAALASRGLNECVTWSFVSEEIAKNFGSNDNPQLKIKNPISAEIDQMRPSILPNLIQAAQANSDRGYANADLYEIGPIFAGTKPEQQQIIAAGIRSGNYSDRNWSDANATRNVDAYDAKADALAALEAIGAPAANAQIRKEASEYYHPGRSGVIALGKNVIAQFGEIHPSVLDDMGIKTPITAFEVFLNAIPQSKKKGGTEKQLLQLNPLQPLNRDFAFIVDENVNAEDLKRAVMAADKKIIKDVSIFDVYQGKGVEEGKKSLALSVRIQPQGQTLKDEDIETLSQKIIELAFDKTGASLRK